jgi:anthranilate/para-aminobenzoate synthase component I
MKRMARLPLVVPLDITFEAAARALADAPGCACIDARGGSANAKRASLVAAFPAHTFSLAGAFVTQDGHTTIQSPAAALRRFCALTAAFPADPYLPFSGGLIGTIGFEGARALRGLDPASGFSRYAQCRMGIYPAVLLFDGAEGACRLVANGRDRANAERAVARLQEAIEVGIGGEATAASERFASCGMRRAPDDGAFCDLVENARAWLRAGSAERFHLVRHGSWPLVPQKPIERFLASRDAGWVRAHFRHEDAHALVASRDALLEIEEGALRSMIALPARGADNAAAFAALAAEMGRELAPLCADGSIAKRDEDTGADGVRRASYGGRLRKELAMVDALMALLPSLPLSGSPLGSALEFIHRHEEQHRGLYGGAFGTMDARSLSFRTIQRVETIADGTVAATVGIDCPADADPSNLAAQMEMIFQDELPTLARPYSDPS